MKIHYYWYSENLVIQMNHKVFSMGGEKLSLGMIDSEHIFSTGWRKIQAIIC